MNTLLHQPFRLPGLVFSTIGASVLAVFLLPVLAQPPSISDADSPAARAMEKFHQRTCLSNQQEIGQGLQMYLQDYDQRFPVQYDHTDPSNAQKASDTLYTHETGGDPHNPTFYDGLNPYLKEPKVWFCPDDRGSRGPGFLGYHANGNVITADGLAQASIALESNLLVLRDSGGGTFQVCFLRPQRFPYNNGCDDGFGEKSRGPHAGGAYNLLFADGSARALTPAKAGATVAQFPQDRGSRCP